MSELNIAINQADHRDGPIDAPISVVHYGDFQCPDSYHGYVVMKKLKETYGDQICYVFRNFPLPFHEYAFGAAQASEIAAEYGKFWEMYDMLYAHQQDLSDKALVMHAGHVGIPEDEFSEKLVSGDKQDKVHLSIAEGKANDVSGTPTFFINGERFDASHGQGSIDLAIAAKIAELSEL